MGDLTIKEQNYMVQVFYRKTFAEMLRLKGIEIDDLFEKIPEDVIRYFNTKYLKRRFFD